MNVVFLNLYHGGHHGQHVHDLIAYHQAHRLPVSVTFVVTPEFAGAHADVVALANAADRVEIRLAEGIPNDAPLASRDLRLGTEALWWARRLQADHLCFLYLDHAQLSLGLRLRRGPTRYSGLHFRPSFHYPALEGRSPTLGERLTHARKKLLVRLMLSNPQLHTLFELDPYAVAPIRSMGRPNTVVALPEPMTLPTSRRMPPVASALEPGRRLGVFFGVLDDRKGISVLLDALERLRPTSASSLAVLFAGTMFPQDKDRLTARIEEVRHRTRVQVLLDDRFLDEDEIQPLLERADLVLAPYVGHVGSSGVLVRSAAAQRPILTSSEGVLGAHVRTHGLGLAVDTRAPEAVAKGLEDWLRDPASIPFDPSKAAAFSAANTSEAFAETIFSRVMPGGMALQTRPSFTGQAPA